MSLSGHVLPVSQANLCLQGSSLPRSRDSPVLNSPLFVQPCGLPYFDFTGGGDACCGELASQWPRSQGLRVTRPPLG